MKTETPKLSLTFRLLQRLGMNYSEQEYGQVSLWAVIKKFLFTYKYSFMLYLMDCWLFAPFALRKLRPWCLRQIGCHVGKGCAIGDHVHVDAGHAELIFIGDHVQLTGGCRLLCHQRNLSGYHKGDDCAKLPYRLGEIHIEKGVMIGMHSMVMPGVTIGEGAVVGAFSLVTKDIPAWTIAVGRPAKVVRKIEKRGEDSPSE